MPTYAAITVRLTPQLVAHIDLIAASRRMTRADWLRGAVIDKLESDRQREELKELEQRLMARFDELTRHVTREIDDLTRRS